MARFRVLIARIPPEWLKFTVLQFMYWFAMSVGNYQTIYLQSMGANASVIGMVNAALAAVAIFASPMWGMVSDRIRSIRKIFLLTLIMGSILFLFTPAIIGATFSHVPLMLLSLSVIYVFRNPANALMDNWLVRYSVEKELNYGSIRSFGSLGFAVSGVLIAGFVANGTRWTFAACSLLMIPVIAVALRTEDSAPAAMTGKQESFNPMQLFRNYHYATFLPFAFLSCLVSNSIASFIPYLLESVGVAGSRYGLISAYTAVLEIPMLLAAAPLRRRFPLYVLSIGCGVSFMLNALLLGSLGNSFAAILLFETFFGMGNGLFIAGNANYVYTLTPDHLKATGQSIYIAATCIGSICGNIISGRLIDTIGVRPMYIILGVLGLFASVYLTATILIGKRLQNHTERN